MRANPDAEYRSLFGASLNAVESVLPMLYNLMYILEKNVTGSAGLGFTIIAVNAVVNISLLLTVGLIVIFRLVSTSNSVEPLSLSSLCICTTSKR